METKQKYFAFISYQRDDEEWAKWLAHALEHYHLPSAPNGRDDLPQEFRPIFRDIDELSAGNLPQQIHNALECSKHLIVICSPQSAKSPWVNKEIEEFIRMGKTDKIFPFIIDGIAMCKNPDDPEECFPPALRNLPKDDERLGANINENGHGNILRTCNDCPIKEEHIKQGDIYDKGRDAAVVKIVAGMLGLSFDTLWQRYEREKAEEERKIREQRDNLLRAQSRFLAEKANQLVEEGDTYTARLLALEALPKDLENPDRPYVPEAEATLRYSISEGTRIALPGRSHICFDEYGGGSWVEKKHSSSSPCVIVFSPTNDTLFLIGTEDGSIHMMDASDGRTIKSFYGHACAITSISFNSIGTKFASCSDDGSVRIWNIEDGFDPSSDKIVFECDSIVFDFISNDVAYSPCNNNIAIAISNKIVIVEIDSGKILYTLEGHTGKVNSIIYCPDGKHVISASDDCTIRIWNIIGGKTIDILTEHSEPVNKLSFSNVNNKLVSCSSDYSIVIWDLKSYNIKAEYTFWGGSNFAFFAPEGNFFVYENGVINWAEDYESITFDKWGTIVDAKFSRDSRYIVLCSRDRFLQIIDTKQKGNAISLNSPFSIKDANVSLAWEGKRIIVYNENAFCIWDSNSHKLLTAKNEKIVNTNFCDNILISYKDNNISLWNLENGEKYGEIPNAKNCFFSPDNKYIVSINDNAISLLNRDNMECLQETKRAFDEERVEGEITYHYGTGLENFFIFYPRSLIVKFPTTKKNCLSKNNLQHNYYLDIDKEIVEIIEKVSNRTISVLIGHKSNVTKAIISNDGQYTFSISKDDNTIIIWDTKSGCIIKRLSEPNVSDVIFNPDNQQIISTGDSIHIWSFHSLQELINRERERFKNRLLTPEERKKYYLD